MPTEKEKALSGLRFAHQTCLAALDALADPQRLVQLSTRANPSNESKSEGTGAAGSSEPSLNMRLDDFNVLLSLLYQNATKLALAAGPSITSAEFRAAVQSPAKEIAAYIDALASCACSADRAQDGRTLVRELRWAAEDVVRAFQTLIGVYMERIEPQSKDSKGDCKKEDEEKDEKNNAYLIRTGAVHDVIDRIRSSLSRNNRAAVRERWLGIVGGLDDCMKEVREMIEEEEEEESDRGGTGSSDVHEIDEIGTQIGREVSLPETKASKDEIWCMSQASNLLKFSHAMAKRVFSRILDSVNTVPASPGLLDELGARGDTLLQASDDLVNALYVPQNAQNLTGQLISFKTSVTELHIIISALNLATSPLVDQNSDNADSLSELTRRITDLKLSEPSMEQDRVKLTKERRWFDVCFSQMYKTADIIQAKVTFGPEID